MKSLNMVIVFSILKGFGQLFLGLFLICCFVSLIPDSTAPDYGHRLSQYLSIIFLFQFQESLLTPFTVKELILYHGKITSIILGFGLFFTVSLALPLGIGIARKPEHFISKITASALYWIGSIPILIWGIFAMFFYYSLFNLSPTYNNFEQADTILSVIIIAPVIMALVFGDGTFNDIISSVKHETTNAMNQPWMKGIKARNSSMMKHLAISLALPIYLIISSKFIYLLSGTIIVEFLFDWRGIGWLIWSSLTEAGAKDYPVLLACFVILLSITTFISVFREILTAICLPHRRVKQ